MTRMQPEGERSAAPPLDTPLLRAGMVVVHFDPEPHGLSSFCRSVALGPEIVDPRTLVRWAPVMRADRTRDLVPAALIVTLDERG